MLRQPVNRSLHLRFRFRVQRRRCFIQHQNRRVADKSPRNAQSLALPAGQRYSPLANPRLIALRQR